MSVVTYGEDLWPTRRLQFSVKKSKKRRAVVGRWCSKLALISVYVSLKNTRVQVCLVVSVSTEMFQS